MARVLVTNDDGVLAPGLLALACALRDAGHHTMIVAPSGEMSGSAASMAAPHDEVRYELVTLSGWAEPAYSVEATPALCVITGLLGAYGAPPDLVVAGINPGFNTGRSTLHSGTIGAALTAAAWGASGLAVSIDIGRPVHWATACMFAVQATAWLADAPVRTVVNLNVPNVEHAAVRGVRSAALAPLGAMRTSIAEHTQGLIRLQLLPNAAPVPEHTDTAYARAGYATVSLLAPPTALDDVSVLSAFERVAR